MHNALFLRNLRECRHKWYIAKTVLGYISVVESMVYLQPLLRNGPRKLPNSVK